jgi:hypothetical protein
MPVMSQFEASLYTGSVHPGSTVPLDCSGVTERTRTSYAGEAHGVGGTPISLEEGLLASGVYDADRTDPRDGVDKTHALYLRNIPPNLMITQLKELLDDHCLSGRYCAIVLPPDLGRPQTLNRQGKLKLDGFGHLCFSNCGYAFISFCTKGDGQECKRKLDGWNQWGKYGSGSKKTLAITEAHVQGLDNLIEKHQNSEVWHKSVPPNCHYLLFDERGHKKPWPRPSKRIPEPLALIKAQNIIRQSGGKFLPLPESGNFRYVEGEQQARLADKGKGKVEDKSRGYKHKDKNSTGFKGSLVRMPMPKGMPMYSTPFPVAPTAPEVCQSYDQTYKEMWRRMYGEQLHPTLHPSCPSPYLAQNIKDMKLQLPQNELLPNLANPEVLRRQMHGEQLYPMVQRLSPSRAGKITGMLLELTEGELMLISTNPEELKIRVQTAIRLLEEAE